MKLAIALFVGAFATPTFACGIRITGIDALKADIKGYFEREMPAGQYQCDAKDNLLNCRSLDKALYMFVDHDAKFDIATFSISGSIPVDRLKNLWDRFSTRIAFSAIKKPIDQDISEAIEGTRSKIVLINEVCMLSIGRLNHDAGFVVAGSFTR
ncbi:hypothetical protein LJR009_002858 [Bosea sp. LjRoot9]|uniref:hypothetical protein n=1 Tax=Bosea sp. LjRoot9 TaxID=3342341 RepID=UPI003ECE9D05